MARPLLPDDQLKHKRRFRKSTMTGEQLDVKKPSKKILKYWQPLLDLVVASVLTQPNRSDNTAKKNKLTLRLPSNWRKTYADWPIGVYKSRNVDGWDVITYNSELLLLWMYKHKIAEYNPNMLYKMRPGAITKLDSMLDKMLHQFDVAQQLEKEYNGLDELADVDV